MEDEFEDRVLYQTYLSHMKLLSKYGVGAPLNTAFLGYIWRLLKFYVARPETIIISAILCVLFFYLQTLDMWSRSLYGRLLVNLNKSKGIAGAGKHYIGSSWELKEGHIGVYSVQGRRLRMEDRFAVHEDIGKTGISLFAIFDGHGGEFAADFAKDTLIRNLNQRLIDVKKFKKDNRNENYYGDVKARGDVDDSQKQQTPQKSDKAQESLEKKSSFRKKTSSTDENMNRSDNVPDPYFQKILDSLPRAITREVRPTVEKVAPKEVPLHTYMDSSKFSGINYGQLITDEVLASDSRLLEITRRNKDVAGTTALIALLEGSHLVVANVGDSRGVMCDSKGNAIPLSFDHKPQQLKESKRIKEAGGFIAFNGVWRVSGILATSRALGDYPLKYNNLVIANPDILTFDLSDHKPQFIVLASDGLWDTFTNEEAVSFIKAHLDEPHYGAKSIVLQSYYRGSHDNITVIVINLKDSKWSSYTSNQK